MTDEQHIEDLIANPPVIPLTRWQRVERVVGWAAAVLAAIAITIGVSGLVASSRNNVSIQGSCQFWHDLSQLPLTATSSKTALTIVADSRIAYARQSCKPPLPAPDPRVLPYLPAGLR